MLNSNTWNYLIAYKQMSSNFLKIKLPTNYMLKILYISSSSYRAGSTDIPDPLSPLLPIVHRPR